MAILVIGGTGFIGPRAIRRLVERGEEVVCMDINPGAASFAGMEDRMKVVFGDVTRFEDVIKAVMEVKPDRILNLAYLLGGGEVEPHINVRLNILGMDNCFEAARLCGVKRVVYVSCNPATQARDINKFTDHSYTIKDIQPLDMFPHTPHIECIVTLINKD